MVFDIDRVTKALDNVTLEIITGIIWNSERLKRVLSLLLSVKEYRNIIKEIDDLPLEVIITQNLYKLNGEIKRLSELRITKVLNLLGNTISEEKLSDEILAKIDRNLSEMNKDWEKISDDFRYKGDNGIVLDIIEGFLELTKRSFKEGDEGGNDEESNTKNFNNDNNGNFNSKNSKKSTNIKEAQNYNLEKGSKESFNYSPNFKNKFFNKKGSEDFTKEGSRSSSYEGRNDTMTFGGISNRFVKISSSINLDLYSDKEKSLSPKILNKNDQNSGKNEDFLLSKNSEKTKNYSSLKNFGDSLNLNNQDFNYNSTSNLKNGKKDDIGDMEDIYDDEVKDINELNSDFETLNQISKDTQKKDIKTFNTPPMDERGTTDSQQTIPISEIKHFSKNKKGKYSPPGAVILEKDEEIYSTMKSDDSIKFNRVKRGPVRIEGNYVKRDKNVANFNSKSINNNPSLYDPLLHLNRGSSSQKLSILNKDIKENSPYYVIKNNVNSSGKIKVNYEFKEEGSKIYNGLNNNDSQVRKYGLSSSYYKQQKSPVTVKARENDGRRRSKTPVRIIKNKKSGKYEVITKSPMSTKRDQRFILNSNKELRKKRETMDEEMRQMEEEEQEMENYGRKELFKEIKDPYNEKKSESPPIRKNKTKEAILIKENQIETEIPKNLQLEEEQSKLVYPSKPKIIQPSERKPNPYKSPLSSLLKIEKFELNSPGLNDISFVDCFNFYGATTEGEIYAYQLEGKKAYKQLEVETLDHIKDLLIDTDHHIVFTQLQSGAFLAGVNGNKFICSTSQSIDPSRVINYVSNFGEILVVTGNRRIESFSQFEEYNKSGFFSLELPIGSGNVKQVIPGMVNRSKAFVLTGKGEVVRVGSDGGVAHVQVAKRGKFFLGGLNRGGFLFYRVEDFFFKI